VARQVRVTSKVAAAMAGGVGHRVEDADDRTAAGVAAVADQRTGTAALDDLVTDAGDGRRGMIFHGDLLTAVGGVAAGVGGAPGAVTSKVLPQWPVVLVTVLRMLRVALPQVSLAVADQRTRDCRTRRSCCRAGDGRRSVIFHGDLLTAVGGVAAGIGGAPGAGHVEGAAAMAGGVGYRVEYAEGRTAAGVAGGGRIKGPGMPHSTILLPTQVMVGECDLPR